MWAGVRLELVNPRRLSPHFIIMEIKPIWFELCDEKKQLQMENHRLKKDSEHYRKEAEKFERMHQELIHEKWGKKNG
jgi:hypothetical protein